MEQLEKLGTQYAADESASAFKQLLRQLDELQKQQGDELAEAVKNGIRDLTPAGIQMSTNAQGQLDACEHVQTVNRVKAPHAVELLVLMAQRLRIVLTAQQKFALMCTLLAVSGMCSLHRLAVQVLFKQWEADDACSSQFVLLRYFTLASQQNHPLYLALLNWVVYTFLAQHNAYAALEFTNRNRAKTANSVRNANDTELATYYYQYAIIMGLAAQYDRAVQLARQARIFASQDARVHLLETILKVLAFQDLGEDQDQSGVAGAITDFYRFSNLKYRRGIQTAELSKILKENKDMLAKQNVWSLARQLLTPAYQTALRNQFLGKIYVEVPVTEFENLKANAADLHPTQDGMVRFQSEKAMYETAQPRQLLLDVLEKKVEAQRLVGLQNVKGEEFEEVPEDEDGDFDLEDFLLYYEGSD